MDPIKTEPTSDKGLLDEMPGDEPPKEYEETNQESNKWNQESYDKIVTARVRMQEDNPFFSWLVMGLQPVQTGLVPTAAVDAYGHIYYNPAFINKLSLSECKTVVTHEVMHVSCLHLTRMDSRREMLWNVACDIVVNNILVNNRFEFTGPLKSCVLPKNNVFTLKGKKNTYKIENIDKKFVEEIYDELRRMVDKEVGDYMNPDGTPKPGKEKEYKEAMKEFEAQTKNFDQHKHARKTKANKKQIEEAEKKWKKNLSEANIQAKKRGKDPAGVERHVDDVLESKINWRELLYKYITRELPFDYTYNYPSKKSIACGYYMPSIMRGESVKVTVAIDVSGSIYGEELQEFLSELIGISKSFQNVEINLMFWDTALNNHYVIDRNNIDELLDLKIHGGGGTDFRNVYKKIDEIVPQTKILIFFTDGEAYYPAEEKYKTLWILSKNSVAKETVPFGEAIKMYEHE